MVHTELAPRRQQFHVAPAMQQPNSVDSTPHRWILKILSIKSDSHSFKISCDMNTVSLLESREQRYIRAINNNNNEEEEEEEEEEANVVFGAQELFERGGGPGFPYLTVPTVSVAVKQH